MARILYLVHRLPYPPNKGDKVRSYHLLRHLAEHHEVVLGTFIDDPDDADHIPTLRRWCSEVKAVTLNPRRARIASLAGLLHGEALTLTYYRHTALLAWVEGLKSRGQIDAVVVFSSSMAPYADGFDVPVLIDFVDVDSAKWTEYAAAHRWPLAWLYRREGQALLRYERSVAVRSKRSFFVTDKERALFTSQAPETAAHTESMGNGVDAEFFTPDASRPSPFQPAECALVFTGAMDYWPNVDAVSWLVAEILPAVRLTHPQARLHIVGRNPGAAVRALASDDVVVTGTVVDVRPYLQHASAVVAPLRLARGIQNKVLEAMAMGRPVVAASVCVEALDVRAQPHLRAASRVADYVDHIRALLDRPKQADALGTAARASVRAVYGWPAQLQRIDRYLPQATDRARSPALAAWEPA